MGAIVIVLGLYMVVWGKKHDYKPDSIEDLPVKHCTSANEGSCKCSKVEVVATRTGGTAVTGDERIDNQA